MRLKPIRDISMRIYSEASIAENPLLAAVQLIDEADLLTLISEPPLFI